MNNQEDIQALGNSLQEKKSAENYLDTRLDNLEGRLLDIEKIIQRKLQASPSDRAFYETLQQRFTQIAGGDGRIDLDELKAALELRDASYAERIFTLFDSDKDGYIDENEFLQGVEQLVCGNETDRLRFAFSLYDLDASGTIGEPELQQILNACLNENQLRFSTEQIRELTSMLFKEADNDSDGQVNFNEFNTLMRRNPRIAKESTLSAVVWLRPNVARVEKIKVSFADSLRDKVQRKIYFLNNNRALIVFSLLYLAINIGLFTYAMLSYATQGANLYVQIARGCGACLNFNGALILVPMLRHFLTWLRSSRAGKYLPLDEHIEFHKAIAHVMFFLSIVHTAAHLLNYQTFDRAIWQSVLYTDAGLSGLLLLTVFFVMWVFALEKIRRNGRFEMFYITHFAFVIWFALALWHGPVFWQWTLLPIVAFVGEKIYRIFTSRKAVSIEAVELLDSKVTHLVFDKPKGFKQKAGDYVFVKIPAISRFEWHPFTLTSCPEDEQLSLHIRSAGDWTGALNKHFTEQLTEKDENRLEVIPASSSVIYVDGPYGTPSVDVFNSEVAILVGAGIGVTPFASVLKTILAAYKNDKQGELGIKKVYFIWLNRSQKSFEWFGELLKEVEIEDKNGLVDISIYMTAGKTDFTASILNLAMDLSHRFTNIDMVTGFNARTHFGRPDWPRLFANIAKSEKSKKVDVFFCGAPVIATQLDKQCNKFNFGFHSENF